MIEASSLSEAERRRLWVEVAGRQEAARQWLVYALSRPDVNAGLAAWAAWVNLERARPLLDLLGGPDGRVAA